jgi:hypothetical protein
MGVDDVNAKQIKTMAEQLHGLVEAEPLMTADTRTELRGLVDALTCWAIKAEDAELAAVPPRPMSLRRLLSF